MITYRVVPSKALRHRVDDRPSVRIVDVEVLLETPLVVLDVALRGAMARFATPDVAFRSRDYEAKYGSPGGGNGYGMYSRFEHYLCCSLLSCTLFVSNLWFCNFHIVVRFLSLPTLSHRRLVFISDGLFLLL